MLPKLRAQILTVWTRLTIGQVLLHLVEVFVLEGAAVSRIRTRHLDVISNHLFKVSIQDIC